MSKTSCLLLVAGALAVALFSTTARAQGTAFTYQGRLDIAGAPANGTNDLTFTLFDAVAAGATVGTSNTFNDLVITNGLFTVTLDFGAGAFNGTARWLQIAARPGVSAGAYTNLAPRQAITPSPYAVFAGGAAAAGVTGTLPAGALSGAYSGSVNLSNAANSFAGNGAGLTSLNASNLTSGTVADARLSTNVALRSGGNTFNGNQRFLTNVGIGTVPVAQLDVRGPSTSVGGIALGDYNLTNSRYIGIIHPSQPANIAANSGFSGVEFGGPAGNTNSGLLAFHTHNFGGGSSERMRIDKSGNVGIGTTTPSAPLSLGTSLANTKLALYDDGAFFYGLGVQNNQFRFHTASTNDRFSFLNGPSGTELFTVRGKGNVGIGAATPNFPLSFPNSGGEKISLYGQDTNSIHGLGIGGNRMEFYVPSTGHSFVFGVGNSANFAEKMRISGDGSINVAAAAIIGSSGRLHIQSQAGEPLYLNPFVGGTDVIIGGGGANPNLVLSGGEVFCVAVNITSDRNAKEQFKPVSAREVLAKVAALPITEWQYKTQGNARHIGPMAQDFHAAFGTGRDDKHITSVDADGVALAAIQGLHEIVQEKDAELSRLKSENQSLAERLAAIERALGLRGTSKP